MKKAAPKLMRPGKKAEYQSKEKEKDVRLNNLTVAKAVADTIRTSLGPKGMDKMISQEKDVIITNDGATILKQMKVLHPAAKMLVDLSKSQDVEAGDGTTTVVVIAGALLEQASKLVKRGINSSLISTAFLTASKKAIEFLQTMAVPISIEDKETLVKIASTSLNSKVVSHHSHMLAPLAVEAVTSSIDPEIPENVDLSRIKIVPSLSGTMDDSELVKGIILQHHCRKEAGGPHRMENAKVALIQFHVSPPKADLEHNVVVKDYSQIDRIMREERKHILKICQQIKKSGANVLLIQKSILRDAITDKGLQILAKMKILVITDIERNEIDFLSKGLGCLPVASVDALTPEKLGTVGLIEELGTTEKRVVKLTGIHNQHVNTVYLHASNNLMLEEAERSLHDALCVVRALIKRKSYVAGGAAPEMEISYQLQKYADSVPGIESICIKAYAELILDQRRLFDEIYSHTLQIQALTVIPYTLAENAGLDAISVFTELKNHHAEGKKNFGINIRKGFCSDMMAENVVQPLLVTESAIMLATETVRLLLKIDDILLTR